VRSFSVFVCIKQPSWHRCGRFKMFLRDMRFHIIRSPRFNFLKLARGTHDLFFSAMRQVFFVGLLFICGFYLLRYNAFLIKLKKPAMKAWTTSHVVFNERLEFEILTDLQYQIPSMGRLGEGTILKGPGAAQGELDLNQSFMNVEISKRLPYDRSLTDHRDPACLNIAYDLKSLPKTSCIIVFYNEPYSVLVRTIWSVTRTAPDRLLKEVILVDDGSDSIELKDKLDYFIATRLSNYNIRIVRLPNR
jgi:Glycosyl transferase family 2